MSENTLLKKLEGIEQKYGALQQQLSDPALVQDMKKYIALNKEYAEIEPVVQAGAVYKNAIKEWEVAKEMLQTEKDEELKEFAKEEITKLEEQIAQMEQQIKILLIPADPEDRKNAIVEIRAGTGGDEASIFAGDLFRMYSRFAEKTAGR